MVVRRLGEHLDGLALDELERAKIEVQVVAAQLQMVSLVEKGLKVSTFSPGFGTN